jgi:DNA polymerase-3 subunit epsilon
VTAWWQGRMCAFDVETTGVDVETARIVTAAVVLVGGGVVPEPMTLLIDPGVEIPAEATAIHGISTEKARADGLPAANALMGLRAVLEVAIDAGYPIVSFNARFDLTVLDRELRRHGLAPLSPARVVDPLLLDKHLDRYRKGSRKLDAICAHRGAVLDGAHEAASDAIAAARLAWVIAAKGVVVRRVRNAQEGREKAALVREWERVRNDVDLLHDFQVRVAREQALGLAQHFREAGKPGADEVRTEWPICPPLDAGRAAA